jgi:hypothetical protein
MKTCFKCKRELPLSEFYKHKQMKDGHLNKCIECAKRDIREFRKTHDHVREQDTFKYHNNPAKKEQTNNNCKSWRERNPKAHKAHNLVQVAVKTGKLLRQPCEVCNAPKAIAHHDDYDKPLDVGWLCKLHHNRHLSEYYTNEQLQEEVANGKSTT